MKTKTINAIFIAGIMVMDAVETAQDIPDAKKGERRDVPVAAGGIIIDHGGKRYV